MSATQNKWLKIRNNSSLAQKLDALMMEAWANDVSLGDFIKSLPKDLEDFFLSMNFEAPLTNDEGIDISLRIPQ